MFIQADGNLCTQGITTKRKKCVSNTPLPHDVDYMARILPRSDKCLLEITNARGVLVWVNTPKIPDDAVIPGSHGYMTRVNSFGTVDTYGPGFLKRSTNSVYELWLQTDGNLVIRKKGTNVWAISDVALKNGPFRLHLQTDGNICVKDKAGKNVECASRTAAPVNKDYRAALGDDGNLCVWSEKDKFVWCRF